MDDMGWESRDEWMDAVQRGNVYSVYHIIIPEYNRSSSIFSCLHLAMVLYIREMNHASP